MALESRERVTLLCRYRDALRTSIEADRYQPGIRRERCGLRGEVGRRAMDRTVGLAAPIGKQRYPRPLVLLRPIHLAHRPRKAMSHVAQREQVQDLKPHRGKHMMRSTTVKTHSCTNRGPLANRSHGFPR